MHVDHESMMTSGLVDWCFSRRTHRRGRMITCRARAARCTRKPSPRPLPGWHFPKPASKFSLPMAVTHINVPSRHTYVSHATHMYIDNYTDHSCNIHTKKERYIHTVQKHTIYNTLDYEFLFLLSLFLSLSYIFVSRIIKYIQLVCDTEKNVHTYIITYTMRTYIYISPLTSTFSVFEQFFSFLY